MDMQSFREGLAILAPYHKNPDGYNGGAEHDQFYVYATERPVSPGDIEKLVALGWRQENADMDEDEDFAAKHYDPEESWTAYF